MKPPYKVNIGGYAFKLDEEVYKNSISISNL